MAIRESATGPTSRGTGLGTGAGAAERADAARGPSGRVLAPADLSLRAGGAVLAVLVAWVHVVDQGGVTALKHPAYVGVGYWLLELTAVAVAVVLLAGRPRQRLAAWWLALGVAAGPAIGYALSRGPGLPGYTVDRGNWTEAIGVQALLIEAALLSLAGWTLAHRRAGDA